MNKILYRIFSVACIVFAASQASAQLIITLAGQSGKPGYTGDNSNAVYSRLNDPRQMACDPDGNLYFADRGNGVIRKISTYGIISTVAGNGGYVYNGDNKLATQASLHGPTAVAFDDNGNMYIAECENHRIRKVDKAGIITTIAGNGEIGYSGDYQKATESRLNYPCAIAVDHAGTVYISDGQNSLIRKIDASGYLINVAGQYRATGSHGDDGLALYSTVNYPQALVCDDAGNLYIAEYYTNVIRKIDAATGKIHRIAGTGVAGSDGNEEPAINARVYQPAGLAIDKRTKALYIADKGSNQIRKIDSNGIMSVLAGSQLAGHSGDGGDAVAARVGNPLGVATDNYGNVYFSEGDGYNYVRYVYADSILNTDKSIVIFPQPCDDGTFHVLFSSAHENNVVAHIINDKGQSLRQIIGQTNKVLTIHLDMPGEYYIYGYAGKEKWRGKVIIR